MNTVDIEKLATLALKVGVNLQKGQKVVMLCDVTNHEVARIFCKKAYELGASLAKVEWRDEKLLRLNYEKADVDEMKKILPSYVNMKEEYVSENYCYVVIDADDPDLLCGIDGDKIQAVNMARRNALRKYNDLVMNNAIHWTIVAIPSPAWASRVFPNTPNAEEKLWEAIKKTIRLDEEDPVKAWQDHIATLTKRADFLNDKNFESVHFSSANGTDLTVGLADGHKWLSAEEQGMDGIKFIANMPTEEVFTAPHRLKVNGVLKSALPLCYDGNIIDEFSITFKDGKAVDYSAKQGYETLKNLIESDEGSHYLGEIALIGKNSPISNAGILYYNTLFDENASCHLAIGKAYPTTLFGGDKMSKEELLSAGANDSLVHCDFMIGTKDLIVTGIQKDGTKIPLFTDGEWCI